MTGFEPQPEQYISFWDQDTGGILDWYRSTKLRYVPW